MQQNPIQFDLQMFHKSFEFNNKEIIGKGFDSIVYKVKNRDDKNEYALKLTSFKDLQHKFNFQQEIRLLYHLNHDHIVKFYGNSMDGSCILIEYMPFGHLVKLIDLSLDIRIIKSIVNQIMSAVQYLHSRNIVHGDIKPENVLISKDFVIKICDFGFAIIANQPNAKLRGGSEGYTAPELLINQNYDPKKCDMFSLGVLFFVLFMGYRPFLSTHPQKQDKFWNYIKNKEWDKFWKIFEPKKQDVGFKAYIQKLLCADPNERYTIEEALQDDWFKSNLYTVKDLALQLKMHLPKQ
ncbi:unnamed protein product (macronuclear) [Paramecium tetraurelia]|uniref:Protein kinase domain-containing protein n=1 Tax=Paramecium tetraurelia TaxID=5888 RepID=A0E496_PARTE|nr:uncharacterized protein GSPATT00023287001 [Paramecium tetraurelia]CAK90113.1 unnamed protein product [Paramecium tetraurelia]|eukprot:XP_001457510.1 hypothetical protein (macronuclear) [Paramecium tetraurelia strain d4-2]